MVKGAAAAFSGLVVGSIGVVFIELMFYDRWASSTRVDALSMNLMPAAVAFRRGHNLYSRFLAGLALAWLLETISI
jgi:hypothetical protein